MSNHQEFNKKLGSLLWPKRWGIPASSDVKEGPGLCSDSEALWLRCTEDYFLALHRHTV